LLLDDSIVAAVVALCEIPAWKAFWSAFKFEAFAPFGSTVLAAS
jgi:hypothetical protein